MTEKNYNPEQKMRKTINKQETSLKTKDVAPDMKKSEEKNKVETEFKDEKKNEVPKIKKEEAVVYGKNLPLSMKKSRDFCKFIKNKKIEKAILDIEQVILHKKAVPARGEFPHKKGKGMAGGIYADKTAEYFLKLLKNLQANANSVNVENPTIVDAVANIGERPYGKFGRVRRKRAHIKIIAKEKSRKEI